MLTLSRVNGAVLVPVAITGTVHLAIRAYVISSAPE